MSEFHERLREARIERGFKTLRAACQRFGWNEGTAGPHETGHRMPELDTIKDYARAYRVSLDWLINGVGDASGKQLRQLTSGFNELSPHERQLVADFVHGLRAGSRRGR